MTSCHLLKELDGKMSQSGSILQFCDDLIEKRINGAMKLKRKVQAELEFLKKLKDNPHKLRPNHIASTNLTHLEAMCKTALTEIGVISVLEPFRRFDENQSSLLVDVVSGDGSIWIKVVARSARGLHTAWSGEGGYQEHGIVCQASDYISTAAKNPHYFKSPMVVFIFCAGVTKPIVDDLTKRFQIECRGELVLVDSSWGSVGLDHERSSCSDGEEEKEPEIEPSLIPLPPVLSTSHEETALNLDITALIAYVSALTNGDGAQYRFLEPLLDEQAAWERERPALPQLKTLIDENSGRRLICCLSAYKSFMDILNTVGGSNEKIRTESLFNRVNIVEDHLSENAKGLRLGGKIKERSRIIFGSGDYYRAVTLTANRGFVQASSNQGVCFAVILHESRALSEQKQQHAVPFSQVDVMKKEDDEN